MRLGVSSEDEIVVYPTEVRNHFTMKLDNGHYGEVSISIMDGEGHVIQSSKFRKTSSSFTREVPVDTWISAGMYLLHIQFGDHSIVRRIIKK